MKKHFEGSLGRCLSFFSHCLCNFSDFEVDTDICFVDFLGIILQTTDNVASLFLISVFDQLLNC